MVVAFSILSISMAAVSAQATPSISSNTTLNISIKGVPNTDQGRIDGQYVRRAEEGEEREMASFRMGFRCRLGTDGVVDFLILRSGTWSHQMLDWKVVGLFRLG